MNAHAIAESALRQLRESAHTFPQNYSKVSHETHLYANFGDPISDSRAPEIYQAFAKQTRQDLLFIKHQVRISEFNTACDEFFSCGGSGLLLNAPLKQLGFLYSDDLTARAQLAGAVNTLKVTDSNTILGDNTEGDGLVADIRRIGWQIQNQKVLVIGAGIVTRPVLEPLLNCNPELLMAAHPTATDTAFSATLFADKPAFRACGFADVPAIPLQFDLIISAMYPTPGEALPLQTTHVHAQTRCYDMTASGWHIPFLEHIKQLGVQHYTNGVGMLVEQAAEAFFLWRGIRPNTTPVIVRLAATDGRTRYRCQSGVSREL